MNENKKAIIEKRIQKTGENLKKNNMEFYYAETRADVCPIVESLIKEGDVISMRGRGRLEVAEVRGLTKKGRTSVLLRRYF